MNQRKRNKIKTNQWGISLFIMVVFFSCKNSSKEINDFLADQNLPIGVAEHINHVYKDSGRVTSRLIAPVLWDYTNRKLNPYSEFPKGVKIVSIDRITRDSVTVTGNYAVSYDLTHFSEIIGDVVVINHQNNATLNSEQMYWDQKEQYFFTESPFTLYTEKDTLHGVGFESDSGLNNWILNNTNGNFVVDNKEESNE
ncbi:LPS export ABC transporter periplasmic protein LptC [Wenyingzhuangia aestuarii]|uniref:LPS export ABC transporter periplasmic protein LptC n=1 Tax=Wenyingzhuangia aestuarii TaxID=1647582 RepID=UPI001FD8249B|nr:LPS export ABC transporter periplasmic protein LptC [Wenyingzhuangia aestuarii]NJB82258.1 LPS export ABC transporter protein LptC [Wenyingzhuangia aestuarii]